MDRVTGAGDGLIPWIGSIASESMNNARNRLGSGPIGSDRVR